MLTVIHAECVPAVSINSVVAAIRLSGCVSLRLPRRSVSSGRVPKFQCCQPVSAQATRNLRFVKRLRISRDELQQGFHGSNSHSTNRTM